VARTDFTKFQETQILGNQDYKCGICSTKFSQTVHPQIHHINGVPTDTRTENGQALCSNCHDNITRNQTVERSLKKKDSKYVKYCCFCGNGNEKLEDATNIKIQCSKCESIWKVIRGDSKVKQKKITTKKYDEIQYCPHCGAHFSVKQASNRYVPCNNCKTSFAISVVTYKKQGWVSRNW